MCEGGTLKNLLETALDALKKHQQSSKFATSFRRVNSETNLKGEYSPKKVQKSTSNGQSFDSVIPLDFIRAVLRQLCDGLSYLHRNGIVHRDLNINNLLLKKPISLESKSSITHLDLKIADFGLALDLNQNENNRMFDKRKGIVGKAGSTICGTPGFIAPEVWRQTKLVSPASDIFSLGSILYALVKGVKSPKGDLNVDKFPSELADLICRLLKDQPDERPLLKDVIRHPFSVGPIYTKRLDPVTKKMNDTYLSIEQDGSVTLRIDGTSIGSNNYVSTPAPSYCMKISPGSENISIQRKQKVSRYTLGTLPQCEWKRYFYAYVFVDTVKIVTPKVTIRCKNNAMVSSIDGKGNRCIIQKGCLMENGSFELTVRDDVRKSARKVRLEDKLKEENLVLYVQAKELHENALKLEDTMENLQKTTGMDCFPLRVGKPASSPSSSSGPFNGFTSPNQREYSPASTTTTTASNILRSITLKDIGTAFDLSDGIEIRFLDGSYIMCSKKPDHPYIWYSNSSVSSPCKFSFSSPKLPNEVKDKLCLVPMAIEKLRQQPWSQHSTTFSQLSS